MNPGDAAAKYAELQSAMIEAFRRADRAGANTLLDAWAIEHGGYAHLFTDVVEPALKKIGEEWRTAQAFSIAQAYVSAKIAEDLLLKVAAQRPPSDAPTLPKGPVIMGNIEEDFHGLGRRMVVTFLRSEGWVVEDMGNDVLPEVFVDKALEIGARVIGVSAMMLTTAHNIGKLREEIDRRGLTGRIQLAVGGAVFRLCPALVQEVGGDGMADNALDAPQLFDRLWAQSLRIH